MAIDPRQKALWLYELQLNGFIILRNFLPNDFVDAMRRQFEPLFRGELSRMQAGDRSALRGGRRMSFDSARYIDLLKGPLDDDRYRRNPDIEALVSAAMGEWRYGVTKAECPLKDAEMMAWHPDVPNDERRDPTRPIIRPVRLTFNVPLVDIDERNGPMEVIPGSHRMYHHGAQDYIYDVQSLYTVKVLMKRGDAMLRDGNILHRGTVNHIDEPRILLDQTYRAIEPADSGESGHPGRADRPDLA